MKKRWRRRLPLWQMAVPLAVLLIVAGLVLVPILAPGRHATAKPAKAGDLQLTTDQRIYRTDQHPSFRLRYHGPATAASKIGWLGIGRADAATASVSATISYDDHIVDIPVTVRADGADSYVLEVNPNGPIKPGKYKLEAKFRTDQGTVTDTQNFAWGVLALNFDKSTYITGETAAIQLGVLDSGGHTLCNAPVVLTVTAPDSSTSNPPVTSSSVCVGDTYVTVPDYTATYQTGAVGHYKVVMRMADSDYEMTDGFDVAATAPFDISRSGPTRIYPPSPYDMTLKVKANQDFSGSVGDSVPDSFTISDAGGATVNDRSGKHYLTWQVHWTAGQTYTLHYSFKAPQVSPAFYFAGPLTLQDGSTSVYKESRQWQIAGDAVITFIKDASITCGIATSCTATFGSATATGNAIIATLRIATVSAAQTISSISDSSGANTWVIPTTTSNQNPPAAFQGVATNFFNMGYALRTGSMTTVTVNLAGGSAAVDLDVAEFSNIARACAVDQSASTTAASGTSQNTPTITTVNAADLIIGGGASGNSTWTLNNAGSTPTSGYTQLFAGSTGLGVGYQVVSSTGSYKMNFTLGTSRTVGTGIMAFKSADYPTTDQLMRGGNYFCDGAEASNFWAS